jgi:glycosyltransferase involved in cell wall biosynthesis
LKRLIFRLSVPHVRDFDRRAAQKVDLFVANSRFVQERIQKYYGRESMVVYPPVDVEAFDPNRRRDDFFLIVSELVPYKKVDQAVRAFQGLPHRLVIIGDGPERQAIERLAGPNIRLLGRQPFRVLKDHMERCRAFLYPQVEDFGITAVEAQAAGAPVIALGVGGATETVLHRQTGLLFTDQTEAGLIQAVQEFLGSGVDYCGTDLHRHAERFSQARFRTAFQSVINKYLSSDLPPK